MRKFLLSLLLIVALSLGGAVMAQDVDCSGLSDADCDIVVQSALAMADVTSAAFDFNFIFSFDGESIGISGDGTFNYSGSADFDAEAFTNTDPAVILGALGEALGGLSASLNLSLNAPDAPPISLNLLLVDNVGYLNFETIGLLMGGPDALAMMGLPSGWAGLDLADVLENLAMFLDPEMMGEMGMDMSADDMEVSPELESAMSEYVTLTRLEDVGGAAVFETTVDFAGLMNVEEFRTALEEQLAAQGQSEDSEMVFALLGAMDFTIKQYVDLSTFYVTALEMNGSIDASAVEPGATGVVEFNFSSNVSGFNSTPAITAPAGAPVATFMDLFMLLGATGGF